MGTRLLIYTWHNVEGTWCFPNVPGRGITQFRRQLQVLKRLGAVVPLANALHDLSHGRPLPARAVALTFDDGYRDSLELAVPVLESLKLPATFFLVPALLSDEVQAWWEVLSWAVRRSGRTDIAWRGVTVLLDGDQRRRAWADEVAEQLKLLNREDREHALAELVEVLAPAGAPPSRLFLDWDDARELVRHRFAIGSHSQFHAILARETPQAQSWDLVESRSLLERELQVRVELLAYPNGRRQDFDDSTVAAAGAAGYTFGLSTMDGYNQRDTPRYEIRRTCIWPHHDVLGIAAATRHMLHRG